MECETNFANNYKGVVLLDNSATAQKMEGVQ